MLTKVIEHTYLADNHSKVILIQSTTHSVAIITSQNLTRGNRHESAIVTTDTLVFATLHNQIQDLIKNHAVPLSELYNAQVQ